MSPILAISTTHRSEPDPNAAEMAKHIKSGTERLENVTLSLTSPSPTSNPITPSEFEEILLAMKELWGCFLPLYKSTVSATPRNSADLKLLEQYKTEFFRRLTTMEELRDREPTLQTAVDPFDIFGSYITEAEEPVAS